MLSDEPAVTPEYGFSSLDSAEMIIDLGGMDSQAVESYLRDVRRGAGLHTFSLIVIVDELPAELDDVDVTFVEAGQNFDATERLSLAFQMVSSERVIVSNSALEFDARMIDSLLDGLDRVSVVEADIPTKVPTQDGMLDVRSSRTVVFGISFDLYCQIRGFDLRIRTARDAFGDLVRRVRQWHGTYERLSLENVWAWAPKTILPSKPQSFAFWKSSSIFVNLPRWKFMPFHARSFVDVVRINHTPVSDFDGIEAQSIDGYTIVDLTAGPGDELNVLRSYCAENGDRLIAPVFSNQVIPPWRIVEQIQQIRTGSTYCVARAAISQDSQVGVISASQTDQPLTAPTITALTTVLARADDMVSLIEGRPQSDLKRVQSNSIVVAGDPELMWDGCAVPATNTEKSRLAPYLDGINSERYLIFDQYTVGRIDYVDGYDRIDALVTLIGEDGQPKREVAAISAPTQQDLDTLAKLGLHFSLMGLNESESDIVGILANEVLTKHFRNDTLLQAVPAGSKAQTLATSHPHPMLFCKRYPGDFKIFELRTESAPALPSTIDNIDLGLLDKEVAVWMA